MEELGRPLKRLKYMLRSHGQRTNLSHGRERSHRRANIDAYFDLSCLTNVKKGHTVHSTGQLNPHA
jgi:hypothetical protein